MKLGRIESIASAAVGSNLYYAAKRDSAIIDVQPDRDHFPPFPTTPNSTLSPTRTPAPFTSSARPLPISPKTLPQPPHNPAAYTD